LLHFFHSFFSKSHWEEMPSTGFIRMSSILFVCIDSHSSEKVCGMGPYTAVQQQAGSHQQGGSFTNNSLHAPRPPAQTTRTPPPAQTDVPPSPFSKHSAQIPVLILQQLCSSGKACTETPASSSAVTARRRSLQTESSPSNGEPCSPRLEGSLEVASLAGKEAKPGRNPNVFHQGSDKLS